jgi:hypothetical protein
MHNASTSTIAPIAVSVSEACRLTGFRPTSLWKFIREGRVKAIRVDGVKGAHEESVWDHLAGSKSAPFEAGEHGQVAVKVIDDRGNELLVVKNLKEPT